VAAATVYETNLSASSARVSRLPASRT
jgi:hypothetical protein